MAQQRIFVLDASAEPVQSIHLHAFTGVGIEVAEVGAGEWGDAQRYDVPRMFQRAHELASARKLFSGFPTFAQDGKDAAGRHKVVLLSSSVAGQFEATGGELWKDPLDPLDFGHFFRVVHDAARRGGFATGFPTFNWTDKAGERRYHLIGIRRAAALEHNVNLPDLGTWPHNDIPSWFRRVQQWAESKGYPAALASCHGRDWNRGWGERTLLSRGEQDLNHLLEREGWKVARVDPLQLAEGRAALVYLLERGEGAGPK